jgi:hypothetical protein
MTVCDPSTMQQIYDTTKITPDEIISLVKELNERREEGEKADYVAALWILFQRYDHDNEEQHDKAMVIMRRMECLVELAQRSDERMRGWTLEGKEEGCLLTNEAVFRATALCPIHRANDHAYFDADEFFNMVLGESVPEGSA